MNVQMESKLVFLQVMRLDGVWRKSVKPLPDRT